MGNVVDSEKISQRAYQIYETRGKTHGSDFSDWIQAEKEVLNEQNSKKQASKKKLFMQ
jgi:outer membrane protein TolC